MAKMKGCYLNLVGGYTVNSMRALTGLPTFLYLTKDSTSLALWNNLYLGKQLNQLITLSTSGNDDSQINSCGVTERHALTLLAAFQLKTAGVA